jgi:hypothetical protein
MQYYPGINAAELLLFRNNIPEADAIFRAVLGTCRELQKRTEVSFWTDFTAGQAELGIGDIAQALTAYTNGLNRYPRPSTSEKKSASEGVRRMAEAKRLQPEEIAPILNLLA